MHPQPQNSNGSSPPGGSNMQQNNKNNNNLNSTAAAASPIMKFSALPSTSVHDFRTNNSDHFHQNFDHGPPPHDDFLEQMLSSLNSASGWDMKTVGEGSSSPEESENGVSAGFQFDEGDLALKLRAQQQQQHMLSMPFGVDDLVDRSRGSLLEGSSFDSFHPGVENQMAGLFNGSFVGSLLGSGQQMNLPDHFQSSQGGPSFDAQAAMNSQAPVSSSAGGAAAPPKQRVRARRGQATDPHSIAERLRRERIAERMKGLQELVPNANKTDKASMLDEIIEYVKFLQLQVKVLSMSRLGGAGAVSPLVADNISKEGVGDGLRARAMMMRGGNNGEVLATTTTTTGEEGARVAENQVAKLMEEDMGAAMQYLQSKGLCLMPISLATAISTAKNPLSSPSTKRASTNNPLTYMSASNGNGPTSPK